ncbi:MAG: hypothetical protein O7I93_13040 [Gemmatimonadetes bacterium]|nr:hypothetical protein [Gemmatimonadota bacterium]
MSGRVYAVLGRDTIPLSDHWILMHAVGPDGGQVVDSGRTDAVGAYVLQAPSRDTLAVYLSSLSYRDIAYFSEPVRFSAFTSDTAETLFVYDTSSVAPAITVVERHVVVRGREADGTRPVLELVVLENRGRVTRIASDTTNPVWQGAIPRGVLNLEVAATDVSPEAVYRRGDSVAMVAALPPGFINRKQLVFGYILESGERDLVFPIDQPIERFQVLIEDPGVEMMDGPLVAEGTTNMEDVEFVRFEATGVPAGGVVAFRLSGKSAPMVALLWTIIGLSGAAMIAAFAIWVRRPVLAPAEHAEIELLATQVAALDERFAATGRNPSDAARNAYEGERTRLKASLAQALAERNPGE